MQITLENITSQQHVIYGCINMYKLITSVDDYVFGNKCHNDITRGCYDKDCNFNSLREKKNFWYMLSSYVYHLLRRAQESHLNLKRCGLI